MAATAGTRLRCEVCGSEAIVISAADPELTCCRKPLVPIVTPSGDASPASGDAPR
jgi:hypothetical protein